MISPDESFALKDENERTRRKEMLSLPHVQPLMVYLNEIKQRRGVGYEMPAFDPCDGGILAKLLVLLEAPGPRAVGSTFISRNNPDQTARNMNELQREAGISREYTILWNIVPWYIGNGKKIRTATGADTIEALPYFPGFLKLLPDLRTIVLMGKAAQSAAPMIRNLSDALIFHAPHPSPQVFNVYKEKKKEAQRIFFEVAQYLHDTMPNPPLQRAAPQDMRTKLKR